ncbi:hypothetical protein JCM11251_004567 [Rhodosporidiobolus azoricus]
MSLLRFVALAALLSVAQAVKTLPDGRVLYADYIPELYAAILGLVLFGVVGAWHWVCWWRNGKQRYMLTLTIGMTCMTLGFVLRLAYHYSPYTLALYAVQLLFLLLSPCAFLATNYVLLKHLAVSMGEDVVKNCLFLPIRFIVKFFVWVDVITFLIQAAGGGASAGGGKIAEVGPHIALAGLIVQLVSFGLFMVLLVVFAFRVRSRFPHLGSPVPAFSFRNYSMFKTDLVNDWRVLFWALLISSIGIMVRCVFRTIEYAQGYSGYLLVHEVYFYVLDALPLFLAMSLYAWLWPTRVVEGASRNAMIASGLESSYTIGRYGQSEKHSPQQQQQEEIGLSPYRG